MTNIPNIGWLYFKDYYHGFDFERYKMLDSRGREREKERLCNDFFEGDPNSTEQKIKLGKNGFIFHQKLNTPYLQLFNIPTAKHKLSVKTMYPGLITGIGLKHEIGVNYESKLGLTFDHATGYPYLPASSIKGALRATFPQRLIDGKKRESLAKNQALQKQKTAFILHLLANQKSLSPEILDKRWNEWKEAKNISKERIKELSFIDALELELFEGASLETSDKNPGYQKTYRSIYERDIFYDGYLLKSENARGQFLDKDFITPHAHPLKSPKPLQFMKILPEVTLQLQFQFHNSILLSAKEKQDLVLDIILNVGLGAKTNVGYGQFTDATEYEVNTKPLKQEKGTSTFGNTNQASEKKKAVRALPPLSKWKAGDRLKARIKDNRNKKLEVELVIPEDWENKDITLSVQPFRYGASSMFAIGALIEVSLSTKPEKFKDGFKIILSRPKKL